MQTQPYNRQAAVSYAKEWALKRNTRYYNFDKIGGDCTNFISQSIYAGGGVMNHTKVHGWYYYSVHDRAPAWTGVPYLYRFLVNNKGAGPFAEVTDAAGVQPGDVIQLGTAAGSFYHSLLVLTADEDDIYVATHTADAYMRPLSSYVYEQARYLHIGGIRK